MTDVFELCMLLGILVWNLFFPSPEAIPSPTPKPEFVATTASSSAYQITKVVDGDTIKVASGESELTIRILGINTPETRDPRKGVECYGQEASQRLTEMVSEKTVVLISDSSQANQDRYGRLIRYVELPEGKDVGELLIRDGYAYEYTYDAPYLRQSAYQQAQKEAEENARGLWSPEICPQATK